MATTKNEIRQWCEEGIKTGATHMIVVCDTYDYDDYPVFVTASQNVKAVFDSHNGPNMQKVMEVYNLSKDLEKQLCQYRSMEF